MSDNTIEDELDEEKLEEIEDAKREARRSKTKWGSQITDDDDTVAGATIEEIMANYGVTPEEAKEMYRNR
jgi:hypothetical protein